MKVMNNFHLNVRISIEKNVMNVKICVHTYVDRIDYIIEADEIEIVIIQIKDKRMSQPLYLFQIIYLN